MTRDETLKIMAVLKVAYPQYYSKSDKQEAVLAAKLWSRMLADADYAQATDVVDDYIKNDASGFPPTIGKITEGLKWLKKQKSIAKAISGSTQRKKYNCPYCHDCGIVHYTKIVNDHEYEVGSRCICEAGARKFSKLDDVITQHGDEFGRAILEDNRKFYLRGKPA